MTFPLLATIFKSIKNIPTIHPEGFHLSLENGYTVSVQWKENNYCTKDGKTAEIAAWDKSGNWVKLNEDNDIAGWKTIEETLEIIHDISLKC